MRTPTKLPRQHCLADCLSRSYLNPRENAWLTLPMLGQLQPGLLNGEGKILEKEEEYLQQFDVLNIDYQNHVAPSDSRALTKASTRSLAPLL